ncbi:xanthine dehydrogenase family protein molybdopterin-binding subunit [Aureimonas ureilytica]|uniref:xanthine dehydrogenase family protein molybdopterin-binding subunit n=1 Tax=Aureimonas ureilytica TaxID=401562 RepID=UPI0003606C37|nr:molybdopterin cofactor-binding domain-containing protein [Aureimonas ureilytica]
MSADLSRRSLLKAGGGLTLFFALRPGSGLARDDAPGGEGAAAGGRLPGSLADTPRLDSWISLHADGTATVFTGKAELGQGIRTALWQIAVEQLCIKPADLTLRTADTGTTPDEGFTAGSQSLSESGAAIGHAAAEVRAILVSRAAGRLGAEAGTLTAENGAIRAPDGRSLSYAALVEGLDLAVNATPGARLVSGAERRFVGQPTPRLDIPAKLTGREAYLQDMRPEGLVHARVVRPPVQGARLREVALGEVEALPGVLKVVRNGSFLGVIAETEWGAIEARRKLIGLAQWDAPPARPAPGAVHEWLRQAPAETNVIAETAGLPPEGERIAATYRRAYQMHGSIGPSCALAEFRDGQLTVWSHTQGVFPDRDAIAELTRLPQSQVRVIHAEGAGCYGHNGADDAAADAALLALALPGRPVRLQWMREDEHGFEPYGSAMISQHAARLSREGRITEWSTDVWSMPHSTRPGTAGNLLAGQLVEPPFEMEAPRPIPQPAGGGDRNAIPGYDFPNLSVRNHFVAEMPVRVSALRSLGAYHNVFALESFLDELALRAGVDPVAFRLAHLSDPRARAVVEAAAKRFGWDSWTPRGGMSGRGFGYARYKNLAAYCAVALELGLDRDTGRVRLGRVVAACDSGEAVNPDGIRNQIEGGIVQAASWTLFEEVAFDAAGPASRDWGTYPILRFADVPASIEVHLVDRVGEPFLGTGEAAQGPMAAAIGNALAQAAGVRLRDLPLRPDRITAALGA